ncbi:TPA: hypothetical protein ACGRPM_004088 [Proteus mirabilis]|nr:hypothetical protein [Providencia rettgeri]EKU5664887.1 hypothetical protein [Morganella morganii]EKU5692193.1 hypothetical protein [Morganella morganii]HBC5369880.1 hypothetical protein [Proteus mirabilis]
MTLLPENYNKEAYIEWHQKHIGEENFEEEISQLRESLKENCKQKLDMLGQLLYQIKDHTEAECDIQSNGLLVGEFKLPTKSFSEHPSSQIYDNLFKSTDSIIEKCWRKNSKRDNGFVTIATLTTEITDLIRTSVICSTLQHAKLFTERLKSWHKIISDKDIKERFSDIKNIQVDQEAKLASGYFAYHTLIEFTDGVVIEVQFYSVLSSAWRDMSHRLYELTRVSSSPTLGLGSPEARLISLGHMLYLAEFELYSLSEELKGRIAR